MTAAVAFLALFLAAAIAALWLGQRRDERDESPEWTCGTCGSPVSTEPPYWAARGVRYCSARCVPFVPRQRDGRHR